MNWFPEDKKELSKQLDKFLTLKKKTKSDSIHGIIVPHAGYEFSGKIAGKAFSLLKKNKEEAIIFGPSHSQGFYGISLLKGIETPLGKINISKNNIRILDGIGKEHSVINQIPFLQKLGFENYLPVVVGTLTNENAKKLAQEFAKRDAVYIFSTDLSHFLEYKEAVKIDKRTIEIIENLDISNFEEIEACGKFPLLVAMHLCRIKNWKPKLIEYKNSGDITGKKDRVVGYASFYF